MVGFLLIVVSFSEVSNCLSITFIRIDLACSMFWVPFPPDLTWRKSNCGFKSEFSNVTNFISVFLSWGWCIIFLEIFVIDSRFDFASVELFVEVFEIRRVSKAEF